MRVRISRRWPLRSAAHAQLKPGVVLDVKPALAKYLLSIGCAEALIDRFCAIPHHPRVERRATARVLPFREVRS